MGCRKGRKKLGFRQKTRRKMAIRVIRKDLGVDIKGRKELEEERWKKERRRKKLKGKF